MATVSQPGSRGSIITTLVVFVILFLVAAVFAVMKHSDYESLKQSTDRDLAKYKEAINNEELNKLSPQALKDLRAETGSPNNTTAYGVVVKKSDEMATLIAGTNKYKDMKSMVDNTLKNANDQAKIALPQKPLLDEIATLADAVKRRDEQIASVRKELDSVNSLLKEKTTQVTKMNQDLQDVRDRASKSVSESQKDRDQYREELEGRYAELQKTFNELNQANSKTIEELNDKVSGLTLELQQTNNENTKLINELKRFKPNDASNAMLRQPDGKIIRIANKNVVYIDLGEGQHMSQGMTFQIYDQSEGIPKLNDEMNDLPPGKASLEVVRVSAGSSECRVMDLQEGQVIQEGDLIANLVYDKNIKTKIFVYGDFDIDHNNVASDQETEIIKRLVVQWGGQLSEKIDVDTDYVVLGLQPEVPNYTKEQIEADPIVRLTYETAKKKMEDYDTIRTKALDKGIPVLNHNRFLYMIGYWGQGAR